MDENMDEKQFLAGAAVEIEDKHFYNLMEAARAVGIHFQTMRNWIKAGTVYTTTLNEKATRPLVPRSEVLRLIRKLDAKAAALEPTMDDSTILMRVEDIVGAANVFPLIKRLLADWLERHQADLDRLSPLEPAQPEDPSHNVKVNFV